MRDVVEGVGSGPDDAEVAEEGIPRAIAHDFFEGI